jgi:TPR repeat protein
MAVKYCNADCQRNHWPKHKKECKLRAAELREEALFKDPPAKEECPICFLPMLTKLVPCISLPPATIFSVPVYDFAVANVELGSQYLEEYYSCCGKSICRGCIYSFTKTGNNDKCPFCNSDRGCKTDEEKVKEILKRMEVNDAASIYVLGNWYLNGENSLPQDREKAIALWTRSADLGYSKAHYLLGCEYRQRGELKKVKLHYEAAAMAGHEVARSNLGHMEAESRTMDRAIKHWTIAASAGDCYAMHTLITGFEKGYVSRESINSTLAAYNTSCAEMRSEARDAYIHARV